MKRGSAGVNWRRRVGARGLPAALALLAVAPVSRADIGYDIKAGVGETDNVRLTPTDHRTDTIASAGFDLTWQELRRTFEVDISTDLEYLHFVRQSYSGEVIGNALASARINLVPQLLRWSFSDNFGQTALDPATASTPNNRENINYFSTGPDLTLPLGYTNELLLDGRYSNVNYQVSSLSANRYSAGLGLRHEISSKSGISINAQHEAIRFDNAVLNPDYDEQKAYLRWDATGVRTRLNLDGGYDRLKLQTGTTSGYLARLELTRQLTPSQSIVFTAGHDFSDPGNEFVLLQSLGGANLATQAVGASGNPFKQSYVTLGWGFQQNRTGFGVDAAHFKLTYEESNAFDETRTTAAAHFTRRLMPLVEAGLYARYAKEQFPSLFGGDYSLYEATALVSYRASARVTVDVEFTHTRREADASVTSYTDNRGWLKFKYGRPLPPQPTGVVPALPKYPGQLRY